MTNITPVVNMPVPFLYGFEVSVASNTTLTVGTGIGRDSTNTYDIEFDSAVTINAAVNGVNGLDTGTFAASTWYNVFIMSDATGYHVDAAIISTAAAPSLPVGYDNYRKVGVARSDGSTHFVVLRHYGSGLERIVKWDSLPAVLSGGTAVSFAAVDISAGVPPLTKSDLVLQASFTPNTAANSFMLRPTGSSSTVGVAGSAVVAAKAQIMVVKAESALASSVSKVDYKVTEASDALTLSVVSFSLSL